MLAQGVNLGSTSLDGPASVIYYRILSIRLSQIFTGKNSHMYYYTYSQE